MEKQIKRLPHKEWTCFSKHAPELRQVVVIRDRNGNEYLYRAMATNMTATRGYKAIEWRPVNMEDFDRTPPNFCLPLS